MAKLVESFFPVQLSALVDLNTRVFNAEIDVRALKEENSRLTEEKALLQSSNDGLVLEVNGVRREFKKHIEFFIKKTEGIEEHVSKLGRENAKRRVERNQLREELDNARAEQEELHAEIDGLIKDRVKLAAELSDERNTRNPHLLELLQAAVERTAERDQALAEAANLGEAFSDIYERWVGTQDELESALDSWQVAEDALAAMEDERDHALLTIDRMIAGIDEAIESA